MSYLLDSSDDFLSRVASVPATDEPFAVSFWFKGALGVATIYALGVNGVGTGHWRLGQTGSSARAGSHTTTAAEAISTVAPSSTEWNHALVRFLSDSSREIVLNGGNEGTNGATRAVGTPDAEFLGRRPDGTSPYTGRVAERATWVGTLPDDTEAAALHAGDDPRTIQPGSLVTYCPLKVDTLDVVGSFDLTAQGGAALDADHPAVDESTGDVDLAGGIAGQATLVGDLDIGGGPVDLAGQITGQATLLADLLTAIPLWERVGIIETTERMVAAGVTTREETGTGEINTNFPDIFPKRPWYQGPPTDGELLRTWSAHNGKTILLSSIDVADLHDPTLWKPPRAVFTFEQFVRLALGQPQGGLFDPIDPPAEGIEHIASFSVFPDEVNQCYRILCHAHDPADDPDRVNIASHLAYGLTTTDFENFELFAGPGTDDSLEFAIYSRWAPRPGEQWGTDAPIVVGQPNAVIQQAQASNWFLKQGHAGWTNGTDINNEAGVLRPAPNDQEIRHMGSFWEAPDVLRLYFSIKGGDPLTFTEPERIESVRIDGAAVATPIGDWEVTAGSWRLEWSPDHVEEGFGLGGVPSQGSEAPGPVRQLRDPHVFVVNGRRYCVLAVRGEFDLELLAEPLVDLAGAIVGASALVGALEVIDSGDVDLAGAINGLASLAGELDTGNAIDLAGAIAGAATLTGDLVVPPTSRLSIRTGTRQATKTETSHG